MDSTIETIENADVGTQTLKCEDSDFEDFASVLYTKRIEEFSAIQKTIEDEGLSSLIDEDSIHLVKQVEERMLKKFRETREILERKELFNLMDIFPNIAGAVTNVVHDDFTECFRHAIPDYWSLNIYYFILYHIGVVFRYVILAPLRIIFILICTVIVVGTIAIASLLSVPNSLLRYLIQFYASLWLIALGAVVKVKSKIPERRKNQVFVSNHTTQLDITFLLCNDMFSVIGQDGSSPILKILQYILSPMENILFQRFEKHDRMLVRNRISEHISDTSKPPILIFPEGVCVNNRYTVMFRKGAFEMENVEICPIAMKYDLDWSDPFKGDEGFLWHLLRLFKSWATVVEIHYLEPMVMEDGENSIEFSSRVKRCISRKVGLKNVNWNGYLKYFRASQRFLGENQKIFADRIFKGKNLKEEEEE